MEHWITFTLIEAQRAVCDIAVTKLFVEGRIVGELKFERIYANFVFAFDSVARG